MAKKKKEFKLESNPNGFSIWMNGLWVVDASVFMEDGEVRIDTKNFNVKINDDRNRIELKAKGWETNAQST